MTKKVKSGALLLLLTALFLGMFAAFGPGVYNDSDQYIKMHIHREPLYPLFLFVLRALFGEGWLTVMGIIQNILAAFSIWAFAEYVTGKFKLFLWEELFVIVLQLMPHLITKYCSSLHLFLTNSVMSEALCIPLFTLFLLECFKFLSENDRGKARRAAAAAALVISFLLSLTRTQMMTTIILWAIASLVKAAMLYAQERKSRNGPGGRYGDAAGGKRIFLRIAAVFLLTAAVFGGRTLSVKSYNLAFNGRFINNTYGTVNTLTNILYAADREDGEQIEDDEARAFFYRMYDLSEERGANYKYAGSSFREKAEHIEQWHDTIKYEMIEDIFYQTYDKTVTSDYITQNLMADAAAGKIIAGVLPQCFGRWFGNYVRIAGYGFIRSVAVVHPLLNWAALLIYLAAAALTAVSLRRTRKEKREIGSEVLLMGLSFLAVTGNVCAVSLTIMALSRYMIYGFAAFYTSCFMLLIVLLRDYGRKHTRLLKIL